MQNSIKLHIPTDYSWKILDKLVEDLSYLLTDEEKSRLEVIIRLRDHASYLALSEEWGIQCNYLKGRSLAATRAVYQITSLLKKFCYPSDAQARKDAAIKKFMAAEDVCWEYNHGGYTALSWADEEWMHSVLTYARTFLKKLLGHSLPSRELLTEWSRHGPGANVDTKDGLVSNFHKYGNWPYSCTADAYLEARFSIQSDPRWLGALEDDYRKRNKIPKHIILNQDTFWSSVIRIVDGNRITFVPKNALTDRSIAIEPALNLYLQLGVDGFIRRRLKRWGVDIDDQSKNQELARVGSLRNEEEDSFVTLDLAAASDSISLKLCELLLPTEWYSYLMKLRSPSGDLGTDVLTYEKMSSMGNGFTFALETALFTSAIYGVMKVDSGVYDPQECAVYGDDLIVRHSISERVVHALNCFGFSINSEKSFFQGPFRESCGADWFNGRPIRPVFLTTQPKTVMGLWTDVNRLRRILSLRWMVNDSNVESLLDSWIPSKFKGIRGPCSDESFDSYKHSGIPSGRYRNSLWRYKRLIVQPRRLRCKHFLIRKLMHDLRGQSAVTSPWHNVKWGDVHLTGSGSRFTVTSRNLVKVGYTYSVADIWRSEYKE
jgi:hypothetical protein